MDVFIIIFHPYQNDDPIYNKSYSMVVIDNPSSPQH